MKLLHLKGENFRSFAEFEFDLNAPGLYSITGPNGAGKSSIFGAIEWALFGGKRGPGTPAVRRHGCDGDCRVELEFEIGGRVFRVMRVDGSDATLTDVATGKQLARGLTDTSHEVAVQLGLTQDMFCGTFYARQKEVQALSWSKSLAERRDQLERLLGIEHLRVAADLAARDAREQKGVVDGLAKETPDIDELREEVERCEREAQEAAPAVAGLEAKVAELHKAEQTAVDRIKALTKQVTEHSSRQVAFTAADGDLKRERAVLEGLGQQLDAARSARTELAHLAPIAARADEVTALEREMDQRRRSHLLFEGLRAKERDALQELAAATDALAALEAPAPDQDPDGGLANAQQDLNDLGQELRDAADVRQRAENTARIADERLSRARAKADAERELSSLADSEARVESCRSEWQERRDQQADIQAQLNHDIKHRDALLGADSSDAGVCPTCQRPLEGTLGDLLEEFESAIADRKAAIDRLTSEMNEIAEVGKQHKANADRAQELRAVLSGLADVGDSASLEVAAQTAAQAVREAADHEHTLDVSQRELAGQIPRLREAAERAKQLAAQRTEALARKTRAEDAAASYAEQIRNVGSNGYDAQAHAQIKAHLEDAQRAVRRSAALREDAEAEQLVEGRIVKQGALVEDLQRKVDQLREHAAEVEPAEDAQETAEAEHVRIADEHEAARRALEAAKHQVSMESVAVNSARARLEDGRKMLRHIESERQEYLFRAAIATALGDYREHASQRARPTLEQEASALLKQVTNGSYPIVRLTDNYLLEIADGGRFHPLKRFSGGEQDLAALCLRLALSRTLARQRGAEQGFVILDEVFGSQDTDRRRLLMQQLGDLAQAEFQQIFVISHTDDVSEHCQLHIKVTRDANGNSVAEGPTT